VEFPRVPRDVNDLGVNGLDLFDTLYDGCAIPHMYYTQPSTEMRIWRSLGCSRLPREPPHDYPDPVCSESSQASVTCYSIGTSDNLGTV
jgi:hypothetical protein